MPLIGVLALQGAVSEHRHMIERCGSRAVEIRYERDLATIEALIIPGGESTTIARLMGDDTLLPAIRERIASGMPVYGTCMGAIFLARQIEGSSQGRLGLMDVKVRRNGFGPQKNSFEADIDIPALGREAFPAVFIRAPIILQAGPDVEVLARLPQGIVMARQANMLVSAFHPELTVDLRAHQYFVEMVSQTRARPGRPEPVSILA